MHVLHCATPGLKQRSIGVFITILALLYVLLVPLAATLSVDAACEVSPA